MKKLQKQKDIYDTIIILGKDINSPRSGQIMRGRVERAFPFINKHIKKIILSGGAYKRIFFIRVYNKTTQKTEAKMLRKFLLEKNKKLSSKIILEENSKTTFSNAKFSFSIMKKFNLNSARIIGSSFRLYTWFFFCMAKIMFGHNIKIKICGNFK